MALVDFSKQSRRACVEPFDDAHVAVGLEIWVPRRRQLAVTANVFGARCVETRRFAPALEILKTAERLCACPEILDRGEMAQLRAFVDDSHAFYSGQENRDSTSLQRECSARARFGNSIQASRGLREMIVRPKTSRNERKATEIGAFEVGNCAPFSCPGSTTTRAPRRTRRSCTRRGPCASTRGAATGPTSPSATSTPRPSSPSSGAAPRGNQIFNPTSM